MYICVCEGFLQHCEESQDQNPILVIPGQPDHWFRARAQDTLVLRPCSARDHVGIMMISWDHEALHGDHVEIFWAKPGSPI